MKLNFLRAIVKKISRQVGRLIGIKELSIELNNLEKQSGGGSSLNKISQLILQLKYQELKVQNRLHPKFDDVEFRVFSQNGEDGILLYIFALIGTANKKCVEICAGNGTQCNTANLIINHGWEGLLFDGNENLVKKGQDFYKGHPDTFTYPPKFVHAWLTAENINQILLEHNFTGEIDLLSLDVDGVDYWLWKAIEEIQPRVVIAEIQAIWGADKSVTVPYDPEFKAQFFDGFGIYSGASLPAFCKLARDKGYRLVGSQRYGFNAFFIRNGICEDVLPEVDIESCFHHPFVDWAKAKFLPMVKDKEWINI
jgi:hypothetical protein